MGGRMGFGAFMVWRMGKLQVEFPRYEYQHLIWKVSGVKDVTMDIQIEIAKQCVANISVLAMPAFIIGNNPD